LQQRFGPKVNSNPHAAAGCLCRFDLQASAFSEGGMRTVVLGSGVIGVTTAWQLAKEGHEVVVIDRQPVAANETSYANAGLVAPGHALTWSSPRAPKTLFKSLFRDDQALRLKLSPDPRLWSWCLKFLRNCTSERARCNTLRKLKLCVYSQQALQELVAETQIAYDGARKGLLYVYRDEASLARGVANMTILRDAGQRIETLDAAGVAKVEPTFAGSLVAIAGGLYCPDDEQGDSNKFTCGMAERLRDRGVEFRFSSTITGFETTADRVEKVVADTGTIAADHVVLALGSYSSIIGRKLGLRLPVYPIKGYSVTLPIVGSNGAPEVGGVDENNLVAWCKMGSRFRLTATAEFSGYNTNHKPSDFAGMIRTARDLFPQAADYERPSYWACLRPMTPEGTPIFGRGRHRNLWINTGQGHMGWTMACGSARITADLIAGRQPEIDTTGMIYGTA
jgi:D-amino-acid dehydrogenase